MFWPLALIALLANQLSPALTPQKAPRPALPKIDRNACPFEGCQFGKWTVREPARIYSTWKTERKRLRTLKKGEPVTALTGVHVTFEPSQIRVTAPMPQYSLKPGDTILGYMNIGEGYFSAWFKGYWVDEFDGSGVDGLGCNRNCTAKLLKPGRWEWWVKLKAQDGTTGWTNDVDKFDGKDALSGNGRIPARLPRGLKVASEGWRLPH